MRTYVLVSSLVFDAITALQLARLLLGWPVSVAGVTVPVWASAIAALVAGSLAVWGLRVYLRNRPPAVAV
jgi:hypothetical protein